MPGEPIREENGNLHARTRQTCRLVGEYVVGCNYGSKNTLDYTYLSAAKRLDAELRTGCEVVTLKPRGEGFAAGEGNRVVYLPGNHDAETWWNPGIRKTLREEGLVHEFALPYTARFESVSERIVYCEHGNQFDPANAIRDYKDPLDTPLGDHVVTDVVRRVVAAGRITRSLDLRDVNKVFPLATIPEWIAGRVFYDLLGWVATRLLLPLLIGYAAYRIFAYLLVIANEGSLSYLGELPHPARGGGRVRGDRLGRAPPHRLCSFLPRHPENGCAPGQLLHLTAFRRTP